MNCEPQRKVADRIVKGVNYDSFTDGILKEYRQKLPGPSLQDPKGKGKGNRRMWCWGKGDGEDGLFKV